jgi:uncharacterized membrane protein YeaQ/YmgE (transglycosylase-associated protein family)
MFSAVATSVVTRIYLPLAFPMAPADPGDLVNQDRVSPIISNAMSNLVSNVFFACAAISAIFAAFFFLKMLTGNRAAMGKMVWAIIGAIVLLAPTALFAQAGSFWNSVTGTAV